MKRGKDHKWQLAKYEGDAQIYAKCSCGFHFGCSGHDLPAVVHPEMLYRYCPNCGARKKWYSEDIVRIDKFWFE